MVVVCPSTSEATRRGASALDPALHFAEQAIVNVEGNRERSFLGRYEDVIQLVNGVHTPVRTRADPDEPVHLVLGLVVNQGGIPRTADADVPQVEIAALGSYLEELRRHGQ